MFSHVLRYLAPLLAYPILTRTLQPDGFAQFALILATSLILSQCIEFGFGLMGVREITQAQGTQTKVVVGEIIYGRMATALVTICGYLLVLPFIPIPELRDPVSIGATLFLATAYGFSSSWYYISIERAPALALQDIICSATTLVLIVLLVKQPGQATLAISFFALPLWLGVLYGHVRAVRQLGIQRPTTRELGMSLSASARFFILTGASSIINRLSVLFLGALSSPAQVAFYAAGERLVTAAVNATAPFIRVLVPRISNLVMRDPPAARAIFRRAALLLTLAFTAGAIGAAVLSPWLVPWFFGASMAGAVPIIIAQMAILPATVANRTIGMLALVPLHEEKAYQRFTLIAAAASLCLVPLAASMGGGLAVALTRAALEAGLAVLCLIALQRTPAGWHKLLPKADGEHQ